MTSKKRLKQRVRWYEKALQQVESDRKAALFEWHSMNQWRIATERELGDLEQAAGLLVTAVQIGHAEGIEVHARDVAELLDGPDEETDDEQDPIEVRPYAPTGFPLLLRGDRVGFQGEGGDIEVHVITSDPVLTDNGWLFDSVAEEIKRAGPAPEHPLSWYRIMEPDWATKYFGFPIRPKAGDKVHADDGGIWEFGLAGTDWWELAEYPPDTQEPAA